MGWATRNKQTEPTPTQEPQAPAPPEAQQPSPKQPPQRNAKRPARPKASTIPAPEPQESHEPQQQPDTATEPEASFEDAPQEPSDYVDERHGLQGIAAKSLHNHKLTTISQAVREDTESAQLERDMGADTVTDAELIDPEAAQALPPLTRARVLAWRRRIVACARLEPNLSAAARNTGISRRYLTQMLAADAVFRETVMAAYAEGADKVKSRLWHLGVEGTQEPVFHMGNEVARVTKYEVKALELLGRVHFHGEFTAAGSPITVNNGAGAGAVTNISVTMDEATLLALHSRRRIALTGEKPVHGTVIEPAAAG